MKNLEFIGGSDDDLRAFPATARRRAGYQLYLLQSGDEPFDWKPMPEVGRGCREIRVREASGAYRVFYVATRGENVFVLHCFSKKSRRTARDDIEIGQQRYRAMTRILRERKQS